MAKHEILAVAFIYLFIYLLLCTLMQVMFLFVCFVFKLVFNFAMLHAEMKLQKLSTPSSAMLLVNGFQLLWVADGFWHEVQLI